VLEVCDVTKRYGGLTAVSHVSFTVRPGEASYELRAFGSTTSVGLFTGVGLISAGVLRLVSLRSRVVDVDESAFGPGDIVSLN
jgi:ABC-type branched-subunit amino acid transport system ATPase component